MNTRTSVLFPFYLDWETISAKDQAIKILEWVENFRFVEGYENTGLIYSTSRHQSKIITRCYRNEGWRTTTTGNNQAEVIREIEQLLLTTDYKHLQFAFYILPISSCAQPGNKGEVLDEWLQEELNMIIRFMKQNTVVMGWQDPQSKLVGPFAIRDGINTQLNDAQKKLIQDVLTALQKIYPVPDVKPKLEQQPPSPSLRR